MSDAWVHPLGMKIWATLDQATVYVDLENAWSGSCECKFDPDLIWLIYPVCMKIWIDLFHAFDIDQKCTWYGSSLYLDVNHTDLAPNWM